MRDLLVACRYLTALPLPRRGAAGDLGRAAGWFPVVGLILGGGLAAFALAADLVMPPPVAAVLVVLVWALLTGGLHLDGLGDAVDGLGGGWSREEALAIMRRGGVGPYGVVAIVLVLGLKVASLAGLSTDAVWRALLLSPPLARLAPLVLARLCPSARADGAGHAFALTVGPLGLALGSGVVAAAAAGLLGVWAVVPLVAAVAEVGLAAAYLRWRLGGLTGDCLGALVEATEALTLLACVVLDYLDVPLGLPWEEIWDAVRDVGGEIT